MKEFIQNFAEQFDDTPIDAFTPDTKFKELEEWNSMLALSIIAMVDEKYGKSLNGNDLRSVETVSDVYQLLEKR